MLILHASDIHFCRIRDLDGWRGKRALGAINWLFFRGRKHDLSRFDALVHRVSEQKPEAVIFTGDSIQLGTVAELEEARRSFRRLSAVGTRVLYLPGNHEFYIRDARVEAMVAELEREFGGEELARGVRSVKFPAAAGQAAVEIILLSQATTEFLILSKGGMEASQWACLERLRDVHAADAGAPGTVRVVAGHFPLLNQQGRRLSYKSSLRQAERLRALLQGLGASLYLCGHIHHPFAIDLGGGCMQLVAGSLSAAATSCEINIPSSGKPSWNFISLR